MRREGPKAKCERCIASQGDRRPGLIRVRPERRLLAYVRSALTPIVLLAVAACRGPSEAAPSRSRYRSDVTPEPAHAVTEPPAPEPSGPLPSIGAVDDERWLNVIEARKGSQGGWATGSFDAERNRITIRTRDVRRFILDTGRIPIDWDRLVVLSIDGRTSELRKRDHPLLYFTLDEHGEWVIAEP